MAFSVKMLRDGAWKFTLCTEIGYSGAQDKHLELFPDT